MFEITVIKVDQYFQNSEEFRYTNIQEIPLKYLLVDNNIMFRLNYKQLLTIVLSIKHVEYLRQNYELISQLNKAFNGADVSSISGMMNLAAYYPKIKTLIVGLLEL